MRSELDYGKGTTTMFCRSGSGTIHYNSHRLHTAGFLRGIMYLPLLWLLLPTNIFKICVSSDRTKEEGNTWDLGSKGTSQVPKVWKLQDPPQYQRSRKKIKIFLGSDFLTCWVTINCKFFGELQGWLCESSPRLGWTFWWYKCLWVIHASEVTSHMTVRNPKTTLVLKVVPGCDNFSDFSLVQIWRWVFTDFFRDIYSRIPRKRHTTYFNKSDLSHIDHNRSNVFIKPYWIPWQMHASFTEGLIAHKACCCD